MRQQPNNLCYVRHKSLPLCPLEEPVSEYLPRVYVDFTERYPDVAEAQGALARRSATGAPSTPRPID